METLRLSFYDKYGRDFVGLNNYFWAFKDQELRRGLLNNLGWLFVVPTLSTAFGLIIANLADRIWWGTFAKSIISMPMAISFVGAGVIWKFIYDYRGPGDEQIGLLNAIIVSFGFEPQAWITIPIWNNLFLMAIMIWIQTGLALVIFSAALRGIPKETLEAAKIDGASLVSVYTKIILPMMRPVFMSAIVILVHLAIKSYDLVIALTAGGPGISSDMPAVFMTQMAFHRSEIGLASASAIMMFLTVSAIVVPYLYSELKREDDRK